MSDLFQHCRVAALAALSLACAAPAAEVADLSRDGVVIKVDAEPAAVDVARDFFVTLTLTAPAGTKLQLPDLRDRFSGFSVAEDFTDDPVVDDHGATTLVSRWRLVPQPVADKYRLAPFVVTCLNAAGPQSAGPATDAAGQAPTSFCTAAVYFKPPAAREAVTGDMEIDPKKDLPPLSWKLCGQVALGLLAAALAVTLVVWIVRKIREAVRVHRMSPIERAYYELENLLKRGLPAAGRYKDFYVELTLVVRRYVQRQHGVHAPNLTTEEFFERARNAPSFPAHTLEPLMDFLHKADLVKFAGAAATEETAAAATQSARDYVAQDNEIVSKIKNK